MVAPDVAHNAPDTAAGTNTGWTNTAPTNAAATNTAPANTAPANAAPANAAPTSEAGTHEAWGAGPTVRPRRFFGWWTLFAVFVVMVTGSGFAFYAQGVYLKALVDEQGFAVGITSAGTAVFFVAQGIGGYYAGSLISRFDARVVITVGALISGGGIAMLGRVTTEWQMLLVFVLFGAGYSLAGLVPATSIVTRWFHRKRSIALSIASSGLSLGAIVITNRLGASIDAASLQDKAVTFALIYMAMMIPIVWLLLRPSPESMGQLPDGDEVVEGAEPVAPDGWSYDDAVRSRYFKVMSAAFILIMAAQVGAIQLLYKLVSDRVDVTTAGTALGLLAGTSVVARITGGIAATKIPLPTLITFLVGVQVVGIAIIGVRFDRLGLLIGTFVLGTAIGNLLMLHPLLLAHAFGVKDYPRIYGTGSLLMVLGVASGPLMVGVLRDAFDFRFAYLTMAVLAIIGGAIFLMAGQPGQTAEMRKRAREMSSDPLAPNVFQIIER